MKTLVKILVAIIGILILVALGAYVWVSVASRRILSEQMEAHRVDFPIPFPPAPAAPAQAASTDASAGGAAPTAAAPVPSLEAGAASPAEAGAPPAEPADSPDLAMSRAVERGRHLVQSRYVCIECHGDNFGGGVMVDAFPLGTILGPNLTTGRGSRTANFAPSDWDRIVRHGIKSDGLPALMPSEDFQLMSDQELSDIVAYIRSMPPVDNEVPRPSLGPLGKFLLASGQLPVSARVITSHHSPHAAYPPPTEASVEFGRHVAGVCTGCHKSDFSGGPILGGDPSWPPSRNLTPHPDALGGWTYEQFARALREGTRPDGTPLRNPMSLVVPYAQRMSDVEVRALWMYLQSLPPVAPAPVE